MNDTMISFTIPLNDSAALNRVSLMLSGLANDITNEKPVDSPDVNHIPMNHNAGMVQPEEVLNPEDATVHTIKQDPDVQPELDAEGLPYDARIHTKGANKKTKQGLWKLARGVDKQLVAKVKAELVNVMTIPSPVPDTILVNTGPGMVEEIPVTTPPPPAAVTPTPPPVVETEPVKYILNDAEYTAEQLKDSGWGDDQIAALPVATPKPVSTSSVTFPMILKKITGAMQDGTLTQGDIDNALSNHGLESLPLLSARPDLIAAFNGDLFG